jgi:hypothetical protein
VVRDLTNVLVHLAPAPVVARIPVTLGRLRGASWETTVVELGTFLAREGAPVAPPSRLVPPGPHERDGLQISFWEHVGDDPERFEPAEAGRSLRDLHRVLEGWRGALPRFDRLDELTVLLAGLPESPGVAVLREAHTVLAAGDLSIPLRPLHGDAHFRNVLWSADGPRWTDLENACAGPVEYDLAAIAWRGWDGSAEALAAYGPHDEELRGRVTPYLALFLAAWTLDLAERHETARPYAEERIAWVRGWLPVGPQGS